ncbi:chemotaxis protein CheA [Planomonospora alba]|uniref:Chemotaxis protein CheA n=2 Tax=Planomonospora alba TaxID=161354 RepID=A0ABP6NJ20_9ACTN
MSLGEDLGQALGTFVIEARELLQDIEDGLIALEDDPAADETVNALFRAVHTLKGSAGLFGLDHLVEFTHVVETVLGLVREGALGVSPGLVSAVLPCADHIAAIVEGVAAGQTQASPSQVRAGEDLLAGLRPFLSADTAQTRPAGSVPGPPAETGPARPDVAWELSLRFGPDSLRNGMDPLAFLRYLGTMGSVTRVTTDVDALPEADGMDPETCYLGFEVHLVTDAPKAEIENVFEFVREDGDIRIVAADDQTDSYVQRIQSLPESERVGDILVRSGAVTEAEIARALRIQQERSAGYAEPPVRIGEVLVEENIVGQPIVEAALGKQRGTVEARFHDTQTIRIDASRLDKLIDLVGELVVAQASTGMRPAAAGQGGALQAESEVMRLVDEVRHSALALRMVPIGTTLRRFERVIRDVSMDLGKEVALVVTGGDAEMDKALVERIGDPLLHLVRNSLDHGIEPPEERVRRGKRARGTLRLNAFHDAGSVVIEVIDDGRGLDRERILAKAAERGLVAPGAVLSDQDVYGLIFEPGFSTAESVSSISGRGVGMDVVHRSVTELRGSIEIDSTPGVGTTMRIRLPLTLAIIDGFLVGVGESSFIIPLDRVTECVELPAGPADRDCMYLRGEVLPFIRLRSLFDIPGEPARRQSVVVIEQSGQRTGLVVDSLMGEVQTVIKPLGPLFSSLNCVSGSTILGNGEVALILDVGPLVAGHGERERLRVAG